MSKVDIRIGHEERAHEGHEQALVGLVVDAASVHALRQQLLHGHPGDLLRRDIGSVLLGCANN